MFLSIFDVMSTLVVSKTCVHILLQRLQCVCLYMITVERCVTQWLVRALQVPNLCISIFLAVLYTKVCFVFMHSTWWWHLHVFNNMYQLCMLHFVCLVNKYQSITILLHLTGVYK